MAPSPKCVDIAVPITRNQRLQQPRTHNFFEERQRLESFENFPQRTIDVQLLANAGFWYTKFEDIVRCAFCNVEIGRWEEGDNPFEEHKKWSKDCSFVNNRDNQNVPIDSSKPPQVPTLGPVGYDECGIYNIKKSENCPITPSLEKLGIHKRYSPANPDYVTLEARLDSYASWPVGLKLRPQQLAEAGFFYTGLGDRTICFQCGGGLKDWAETDEPWREHALYFNKCGFVIQTKGREYISEVLGKKPPTLTPEEIKALAIPKEYSNVVQQCSPVATLSSAGASASASASASATASSSNAVTSSSGGTLEAHSSGTVQENEVEETNVMETSGKRTSSLLTRRLDDARACKICFSEEIGVAFLPCGHLVSCVKCVSSLTTCAVCREPFSATVRVYLS